MPTWSGISAKSGINHWNKPNLKPFRLSSALFNEYNGDAHTILKEIIYATVSGVMLVYMLWFIIPLLKTVFNNQMTVTNQSGTMVQTIIPVANAWFTILPIFIPLVGGFVVVMYLARRESEDAF